MRKRITSLLLAFVLCLTLLPGAAFAEDETSHTHCFCGGNVTAGDHTSHTSVTYQPWDGTSDITYDANNTAYVYLTDDAIIPANFTITGKTLYLCLNGKTYSTDSKAKNRISVIGSSFILCDCTGNGKIEAAEDLKDGGAVYLNSSTMDFFSGCIDGLTNNTQICPERGGAIFVAGTYCILNVYEGIFRYHLAGNGGAIYMLGGTVNVYGGTFERNFSAWNGGAIYMYNGTVNIFGGRFLGNGRNGSNLIGTENGGAIYVKKGTLNIRGGTFSENAATTAGGAIYISNEGTAVNISGSPKIDQNQSCVTEDKYQTEYQDNIYLASGKTLTIDGSIGADAHIGISMPNSDNYPVVFTEACDTDYADVFFSDNAALGVQYNTDKKLQIYLPDKYTITYELNGGTINSDDVTEYFRGVGTALPQDVTREGYTFGGWYDNERLTGTPVTQIDSTETGNKKYWAKWTANQYTITFDTDGGTAIEPITQDYGTTVTAPAAPTKTGYTFSGWDRAIPATMPAENMTVKALWTVNQYTITFDTDGGTVINPITQDYGTTVTAPAAPSKTGYTFAGWDKDVPETMPAEDLTLTAQWTVNQYMITYELNGGDNSADNPETYTYGVGVSELYAPTRRGYRFGGWYDNPDFEGNAVTGISTDKYGDITLYAKWTRISSGGSDTQSYSVFVKESANGSVTTDRKTAAAGTTVTITVTPDKGYTLETLTVTDKNRNELKLTDKGDGKYTFTMPASSVTVKATFMDDNTMLNFFVDVKASDYYYDAVLWAAQNGITSGTDAVHFSPDQPCTRAQIVTFLWRAAGSPVVNYAMNMTDVSEDAYYAEAVRWALSEGITTGTTATTFGPNETCTRAQAVAFLFRYAAPEAVTLQELVSGFSDAASVPGYALSAMNWALADGIVQGNGSKLMPNDSCTRAQIVTFLYRTLEK